MSELKTSTVAALLRLGSIGAEASWEVALQEILRVASDMLDVARASYWRFRDEPLAIVCELAYLADGQRFERGFVLREYDAPRYFDEIRHTQILAADDARQDPRTRGLAAYLDMRGIGSLLDGAVRLSSVPLGILCIEHVGAPRRWTAQEQEFAFAITQIIAARLEARARSRAEDRERRTALLADVLATLTEARELQPAAELAARRALPALGEAAMIATSDDHGPHILAAFHSRSSAQPLLDEFVRQHPITPELRGFAMHVMREQQSILLPSITRDSVRAYGIADDYLALMRSLDITSLVAAPMNVRGQMTGAIVFGSGTRVYEQDDLRFAEIYAQRIGLLLENVRLFQRAQEAIRIRDDFLSLASHELRTPLTALRLSAHALVRATGKLGPATIVNLSERILRQVSRLDRLTNRLMSSWQTGNSHLSIDHSLVDLSELVRDVASAFGEGARQNGGQIVLSADDPVIGYFDSVRIEQMMGNLIDNAIKFGAGKPIDVSVRADGPNAIITIRDRGIGISEAEQPRVFDRYVRGTSADGFGGLGLGLHLVREIARAHGGTVRLESQARQGTTITVMLPITPARANEMVAAAT